ncbi:MAG: hypothetical protein ACBR20_07550 [Microcoleus sp.]
MAAGRWRDRPSSIPDAKPAIALLELVKKCDRFLAIFGYMERAIPYGIAPLHGLVDGQGRSCCRMKQLQTLPLLCLNPSSKKPKPY